MDEVEIDCGTGAKRVNWKKSGQPADKTERQHIGTAWRRWAGVNADVLQMNETAIEGLCKYIIKRPAGKETVFFQPHLERPETKGRRTVKPQGMATRNLWKGQPQSGRTNGECRFQVLAKQSVEQAGEVCGWGIVGFSEDICRLQYYFLRSGLI